MAKRGRPKKEGKRQKNGRLIQPTDYGPPEVVAKRGGLQGETNNPLPALVAKGVISDVHAEAGELFASARRRMFGNGCAPAARYDEFIPGEPDYGPADNAKVQHEYYAARRALMRIGRYEGMRALHAVQAVCVEWRPIRRSQRKDLVLGLSELCRHYRLTGRREAA